MLVREGFPKRSCCSFLLCPNYLQITKIDIELEVHKHPTEIIVAAASVPSLRFDPQLAAALCDQMVGVVDRVEGH